MARIYKESKYSLSNIFLCVSITLFFVLFTVTYNGSFSFFYNRTIFLLSGLITSIIFSSINRYWKMFSNNVFFIFYFVFMAFLFGLTIFIELGNYVQPLMHEGNWGQVDGNFIAVFWGEFKHKLTFGYIIFRLSNIFLYIASFYTISFKKA